MRIRVILTNGGSKYITLPRRAKDDEIRDYLDFEFGSYGWSDYNEYIQHG